MKRIAWLTDIHLNFLSAAQVVGFCQRVSRRKPHVLLVGGDIAESPSLEFHLQEMARQLQRPIYFVLGNHDFYFGSIDRTRWRVSQFCQRVVLLHWLPKAGVVELTPQVGLIGHGGYADGRLGQYANSDVVLSDYTLIAEFANLDSAARLRVMQRLADEATDHVRQFLPLALDRYRQVFFLTHVPPFKDAAWHRSRPSNDNWLPHFSCKAVGDAIVECMQDRPDRRLTILCGHTHGSGRTQPLPNVEVITGGAEYGKPKVNKVFECD